MSSTAAPPVCGLSPQRQECRRLFCDRRRTSWRLPSRAPEGLAQPHGEILAKHYWQAARNTTVSIGQATGVWRCPCSQSEALHFSAVRTSSGWPSANPFALQALTAALAQSAAPLPAIAHGSEVSITFEVADFTIASAAFFIACCVAVAASFAASADLLLKSSILDCCSLSLALKSATESCHQLDRSSKKPRFSAGACAAAALGGDGCGGSVSCGAACCGPADVAGAAEGADDGSSPLCASAAEPQASNDTASQAPRKWPRIADAAVLLLLTGVTATPPALTHDMAYSQPRWRTVKRPPAPSA